MSKCLANIDRLRGYRIKLYLTEEQKEMFRNYSNTYRAVYNIGLASLQEYYQENGKYITYFNMAQKFSDMRNNCEKYLWLKQTPMSIIRQSLVDLNHAFQKFFNKISRYPKFKSKKEKYKSIGVRSDRCYIKDNFIYISGIGFVDAKNHNIPVGYRMYSTRISYDGYSYFFSCQIEKSKIDMSEVPETGALGIDVGIRNMITTSNGDVFRLSDASKYIKRLKRQQRRLDKYYRRYMDEAIRTKTKYEDIPKSKNMQKKLYLQHKTYNKISNKKNNDIHLATRRIVDSNPSAIVIEGIKISEQLVSKPWLKKYIPQIAFYEIHRQLKYKAADRDIPVIVADKNYPSSQICSSCGHIKKVYSEHTYKCQNCGLIIDRDLNAAINLRNLAYQTNSNI